MLARDCLHPIAKLFGLLADVGYDPEFGARPLKRAIQREVQDPLALKILSGDFSEGDMIEVTVKDGELTLKKKA